MDYEDSHLLLLVHCTLLLQYLCLFIATVKENERLVSSGIAREPSNIRKEWRDGHMYRILWSGGDNSISYLRMDSTLFMKLVYLLKGKHLLEDSADVCVEEQVAMCLHILGHKTKNRVCKIEFVRSGETVSRYFNKVLGAICAIRDDVMEQPGGETPEEIKEDRDWFPFFKVYL